MKKSRMALAAIALLGMAALMSCGTTDAVANAAQGAPEDDGWVRPVGDKSAFKTNPSGKRGLCYNSLNAAEVSTLARTKSASGNSLRWVYNWANVPTDAEDALFRANGIQFVPMAWNTDYDEAKLRAYYVSHPGCKYLLGYNEPNMGGNEGGAYMTPAQAAADWPRLEKIAEDYGLYLVSPAMTYSGATLSDGRQYGTPESWMDAFIREYQKKWGKNPRFDYLALHSYMNEPGAVDWFVGYYADMYGKQVWLTEFCAWEYNNGGQNESMEAQTSSMREKVAALDANPKVARYAWFMSHGETTRIPFNSIFVIRNAAQKNGDGSLTALGEAYLKQ